MDKRFAKQTTYEIYYSDLEAIIKEHYGFEYSIPVMEEKGNDICLAYDTTSGVGTFDKEDIQEMKDKAQGKMFRTGALLRGLAVMGVAPKGNIIVSICW